MIIYRFSMTFLPSLPSFLYEHFSNRIKIKHKNFSKTNKHFFSKNKIRSTASEKHHSLMFIVYIFIIPSMSFIVFDVHESELSSIV